MKHKRPIPTWFPQWEKLRDAYPVGKQFDYLGRKMIVTKQRQYWEGVFECFLWVDSILPAIFAEYVDDHGVIREHVFDNQPWKLLP